MDPAPLTLVSFAQPKSGAAVHDALRSLGYRAQLIPHDRLPGDPLELASRAIVFLLGSEASPRDPVLKALRCLQTFPSLAMVVKGECDWDQDLVAACCDCAQWPCAGDELAFRLGRLCRSSGDRAPAELDPVLIESLAGLNLIGRSPAFLHAMACLRRLLPSEAPVLIQGETGTGKELAARALHYLGPRANGPFVPVNCAALPDHLVENELFGHERGAYTDANASARGAIGEAVGGTLFLDEVEALSPKAQAALLRFLQDKEYRPLGGGRARRADTRVIAASNADLRSLSERRAFRPDLYFRLDILSVTLPPLRARGGDLELLSRHFLELYCGKYRLARRHLDGRSVAALRAYTWPGNVRELENLVHRSVLMGEGPSLDLRPGAEASRPLDWGPGQERAPGPSWDPAGANPVAVLPPGGFAAAKARAIESFERAYLAQLMEETGGNVTQAARRAAKERRALGKLLKKHAIRAGEGP
jgi:DNA-binding NtrC family response regulator